MHGFERGAGSVKTSKFRRTQVAVAVAAVGALTIAGCGSGTESNTGQGEGEGPVPEPSEPVEISFQSWVGNATMKEFVQQFEKEHPNITIKLQNAPSEGASTKLTTQIAGGNPPDVAWMSASDAADFGSRGALVNLDDYIARSDVIKPDDYVEAFKTFVTYEDSWYGLPLQGETTGLFYRTDLFEEAGIEGPPKTWEEFEETAAKLTDPEKNQYGFEIFASEAAYYWYPWLYQAGGDLLSEDNEILFDSEEGRTAAEYYVGLADYAPRDYFQSNSYDGRVAFIEGQVGMYMAGNWFAGTLMSEAPQIDGKWATAPLPEGAAGCKTTIAGDAVAILSATENPDAAWKWIEFLSQPEILAEWNYGSPDGTNLPALESLLESPELVEQKPVLEGFAELMKCGVASTVSNPKFPEVETVLNDELGKAIYGDQTAAEALENAAAEGEKILNE
jgi:multiple sugar transport system substrate-binding protein